jgi:CheY-like chemotaxis protein
MTSAPAVDLTGRRLLVVEDQFLVALDLEQMLQSLGATDVDLASSIADALTAIERGLPDFAILDVKLGTETTAPIAHALSERGVPFFFVSGYSDLAAFPEPFRNMPLVRKPIAAAELVVALVALVATQRVSP